MTSSGLDLDLPGMVWYGPTILFLGFQAQICIRLLCIYYSVILFCEHLGFQYGLNKTHLHMSKVDSPISDIFFYSYN